MDRPLLLRGARQLLTLRGPEGPRRGVACLDLGIIPDGSVLIRDGRIVNIGQSRRVDNLTEARDAIVHDMHGCVVMPGFVDANLALPDNPLLLRRLLQLAFSHGSTTVGARARYSVLRGLAAGNPSPAALVSAVEIDRDFDPSQLSRAVQRDLVRFLRIDLLSHSRDALRFLHTLGPSIRAYASYDGDPDWIGLALAFGASTLELERPLNHHQVNLLAACRVCAVITPASAAPARSLLDADVAVALGSGFVAASGATCSMQAAALLACRQGRLDIAEAITLSTINAAHALGVASECGSLEVGKRANLLALHLSDVRDMPDYHGVNVVSKNLSGWYFGVMTGSCPIVECVANFSEGRRPEVIEAIADAVRSVDGAALLDIDSDFDHNRSVLTFAGPPEAVGEAAVRATGVAAERIDLNQQNGVHPRIGAADVIPFVPLRGVTLIECGWIAHSVGAEIWNRFRIPVYLYGEAAVLPSRRTLPNVRHIGYEKLREAVKTDILRFPDYGQAELHPTAGAVAVGARKILIAWNIELETDDPEVATSISSVIRESNAGFPGVRALGFSLASKGITQVSINFTDYEATPPHIVLPRVEQLAAEHGVAVRGSELIGLIPQQVLDWAAEAGVDPRLQNLRPDSTIEARLEAAGL